MSTPAAPAGFGPLLANRSFLVMWLGQCCSQVADKLVFILLVETVSGLTASPRVMSVALALHTVPNVLFGALAGVWVDRVDKRAVMIGSNVARAALVLGLGLFGHAHVALAIALAFLVASASQPFIPAEQAAMPLVVPREHLLQANSVFATTMIGSIIVAFTLGEPLTQGLGTRAAAWWVAGTFLASVGFLSLVRYTQPPQALPTAEGFWAQFAQGLAYIRSRGGIRRTLALQVAIYATLAALSVLAIIYAKTVLHTNFSWFLAVAGLGLGAGAWVVGHPGAGWSRDATVTTGFVATGAALVGLAALGPDHKQAAFALAGLLGCTAALVAVPLQTRLQELVEEPVRGKVFGAQNMVLNLAATVPLGAIGFVVEGVGVAAVLAGLGSLLGLVGLGAWLGRLGPEAGMGQP
ncbi:MAG: MFS transporter [Candidatus Sericytochromatia bacterium]|nr:MFS transporter [Candidatus Sericytochromatia bacterium]